MPLQVTQDIQALTGAINNFDPDYHTTYFQCRQHSDEYLSNPTAENAENLANSLHHALIVWGAGNPLYQNVPDAAQPHVIADSLKANDGFRNQLVALRDASTSIGLDPHGNRRITQPAGFQNVAGFDRALMESLTLTSAHFLIGNTNITYPTKCLLLLTGLMPAIDSRVRDGMTRIGYPGLAATQNLLPPEPFGNALAKKLKAIPFILADCWGRNNNGDRLIEAAQNSNYPQLAEAGHRGRIFDIVLFSMANQNEANLLSFEPGQPPQQWYNFPQPQVQPQQPNANKAEDAKQSEKKCDCRLPWTLFFTCLAILLFVTQCQDK